MIVLGFRADGRLGDGTEDLVQDLVRVHRRHCGFIGHAERRTGRQVNLKLDATSSRSTLAAGDSVYASSA